MTTQTTHEGCGSAGCGCGQPQQQAVLPVASVNGVALHPPGARPAPGALRERVCAELLRQAAVAQGLLPEAPGPIAPTLTVAEQQIVEAMVDEAVTVPPPDEAACQRYYERHATRFRNGMALQARHILFAVTPGVDVHALSQRAQAVLLALGRPDGTADLFAQQAAALSNCPSGAQGGDLGWIGPQDCVPELASELFHQSEASIGLLPRLVRTRFGLHIVEVLAREPGQLAPFAEVRGRIAAELTAQARLHAVHLFLERLAAEARLEGVSLDAAEVSAAQGAASAVPVV